MKINLRAPKGQGVHEFVARLEMRAETAGDARDLALLGKFLVTNGSDGRQRLIGWLESVKPSAIEAAQAASRESK